MAQRLLLPALVAVVLLLALPPTTAKPLPSIRNLVSRARSFADDSTRHKGVPLADRIAVMYLHTRGGVEGEANKDSMLYRSVTLLMKHIGTYTPLDIYVFVPEAEAPQDPGTHAFTSLFPNIAVMPIYGSHWHRHYRSNYQHDSDLEVSDYHIMGQWRLEVQFNFGALMGYDYLWQLANPDAASGNGVSRRVFDLDSFIVAPYPHNILDRLRSTNALMAGHEILKEYPYFFNGLPELARAFIVMHTGEHAHERYSQFPPEKRWEVSSALYKHCRPPNIMGLHSSIDQPGVGSIGYDNTYMYGNFVIVKSELWLQPLVQDFVQLCLASGGVYRYRWNEQSVEAFIWLMFVEEHQLLYLHEDIKYWHERSFNETQWKAAMLGQLSEPSMW